MAAEGIDPPDDAMVRRIRSSMSTLGCTFS